MANPYYDHGTVPATGSNGSSASMRAEFDAIEAGFDKLPTLSGYGNKAVVVNAGGTALTTTGALSLAGALTTSGAYDVTFTLTAATTLTLPTTGTLATLAGTETLTNKTLNLTSNTLIGTIAQFNTACSDADFATLAGTETLTNKTLNLSSNTLTGTIAQFNSACSDADFATLSGTETLSNKTFSGSVTFTDSALRIVGSSDATKILNFEVDGLTTGTTRTITVQDKNGTLALTSEFDYAVLAGSSGRMPFPSWWMQGLTYGNSVADATNDIDIAAGQCRDATNSHNIILSALTKQLDAAWAVGTNAGGLDTGVVGNNDYYIWAIKRSDTGVCDVLFSLSSTAPTMPANYDYKRLFGWLKRASGAITPFSTIELPGGGLEFNWVTPALDVNLSNTFTTARRTDALRVPQNFSTLAHVVAAAYDASANFYAWIGNPAEADAAPSAGSVPVANISTSVGGRAGVLDAWIRTNSSGQVASRADLATVDQYTVSTIGFMWGRRA